MITENYLDLPRRLIISTHDNVLALALYFLIARLFLATGGAPVPLSCGDAQRYDPTLTEGGFRRAIKRLVAAGWLIQSGSYKGTYLPTWGRRRDAANCGPYTKWECHLWAVGKPRLGCPVHIAAEALRVDRDLLDVFVGRLIPDARFVCVERYLTKPLLRLADIGAYIAARGGYAIDEEQAKTLARWGLWHDGRPALVPPGEREVLALVSQRASIDGPRLTEAGWRRLGWPMPEPTTASQGGGVPSATLIFVAKDQAAHLIPSSVGCSATSGNEAETRFSASASAESAQAPERATLTGNLRNPIDSRDLLPLPPPQTRTPEGGGCLPHHRHHDFPDTPSARLLAEIGCYPTSIAELAEMPVEQVGGAVAYARSQPNITSVPAWVVDALRRMRDEGWSLPEIAPAGQVERWSAERTTQIAGGWGDLFRLGSDTSDLEPEAEPVPAGPVPRQPGRAAPAGAPALVSSPVGAAPEGAPGRAGGPRDPAPGAAPAPASSPGRAAPAGAPGRAGAPRDLVLGAAPASSPGRAAPAAPDRPAGPGNVAPGAAPAGAPQARVTPGVKPTPASSPGRAAPPRSAPASGSVTPGAAPAPAASGAAAAGAADPAEGARIYVLNRQMREELRKRCDRGYHTTISRLQLQIERDRTVITCANLADRSTMAGVLIGALRAVLGELGVVGALEIVAQDAPPVAVHRWATEPPGGLQ